MISKAGPNFVHFRRAARTSCPNLGNGQRSAVLVRQNERNSRPSRLSVSSTDYYVCMVTVLRAVWTSASLNLTTPDLLSTSPWGLETISAKRRNSSTRTGSTSSSWFHPRTNRGVRQTAHCLSRRPEETRHDEREIRSLMTRSARCANNARNGGLGANNVRMVNSLRINRSDRWANVVKITFAPE